MNGVGPSIDNDGVDPNRFYPWKSFCVRLRLSGPAQKCLLSALQAARPEGFIDANAQSRALYGRVGIEFYAKVERQIREETKAESNARRRRGRVDNDEEE